MMKSKSKLSTRSDGSIKSSIKSTHSKEDPYLTPLDLLIVRLKNVTLNDDENTFYKINISFFNQLLVQCEIRSSSARHQKKIKTVAIGTMHYDPSDYEKMCLFADYPLVVYARAIRRDTTGPQNESTGTIRTNSPLPSKSSSTSRDLTEIYCCNVDILPIFIDHTEICVRKRLQPMVEPQVLMAKSWDNLPLLTLEVVVKRHPMNKIHHDILKKANHMSMTVIGAYNMIMPHNDEFHYTVATHMPLHNEQQYNLVTFNNGHRKSRHFKSLSVYPSWETMRSDYTNFTKADLKFQCDLEDVVNKDNIDLGHYLNEPNSNTTVWESFHRALLIGKSDNYVWNRILAHQWPLELHMTAEFSGYSLMAPLNLLRLLYPGETKLCMAVPLQWLTLEDVQNSSGFPPLLIPIDKVPSIPKTTRKHSKSPSGSLQMSSTGTEIICPTGADENSALILVEIKLRRPLHKSEFPLPILRSEIREMLEEFEKGPDERECTGRGYHSDWQKTAQLAATSLKRVPYYGKTDICSFNRQLSETRTRVELMSSFIEETAKYVNENFVLNRYINCEGTYKEMLLMSHACLMKEVESALINNTKANALHPILRAARHSRQVQDNRHACKLYMRLITENANDDSYWRELGTCLKSLDQDCAYVCVYRALMLNPRHPLTLLSMCGIEFESDPNEAELFIQAMISFYPYYTTLWYIAYCYYVDREMFAVADKIMEIILQSKLKRMAEELPFSKYWECELGDWWEETPLLPGMNEFYIAADLLLRLRALRLADISVAQSLIHNGEKPAYFHLVALCCRLRGEYEDALCHTKLGRDTVGETNFLTSLEAECLYKLGDNAEAMFVYQRSGCTHCLSAYSILLSIPSRVDQPQRSRSVMIELIRRQPSAYAWVALANDWLQQGTVIDKDIQDQVATTICAQACAIEALRIDRTFTRAWCLLANLTTERDRRLYCRKMAIINGSRRKDDGTTTDIAKCYILAIPMLECCCYLQHNSAVSPSSPNSQGSPSSPESLPI